MDKQRYADLSCDKPYSVRLASVNVSRAHPIRATIVVIAAFVVVAIALAGRGGTGLNEPVNINKTHPTIGRYTSQSERLTEYLFEGVEKKSLWV